jgi:hypothetical protein
MGYGRIAFPKRDARVGYFGAPLPQWLRVLSDPPPKLPEDDWPWIEHIRMTGQLGSGGCDCWYNPQPYESDEPLPLNKNVAEREHALRARYERAIARRKKLANDADGIRLIRAANARARRAAEAELARQQAEEARVREAAEERDKARHRKAQRQENAQQRKQHREEDKQEQIRLATELAERDKALVLAEQKRLEAAAAQTLRDAAKEQARRDNEQARRDNEWAAARPPSKVAAMFPGWDDAEFQFIRFIQQSENWVVETHPDDVPPAVALSYAHICDDYYGHRFRGGLIVPALHWMRFLAQYRHGLLQYFDFMPPRRPAQFLNAHEREVHRLELLRMVRQREQYVIATGGLQAKRSLAQAFGVDHQITWDG